MAISRLDASCKYDFVGVMLYRWTIPTDIETDTLFRIFRLRLTTDIPPTNHLSGKFRLLEADAAFPSPMQSKYLDITGLLITSVAGVALAVTLLTLSLVLTCWTIGRLHRRLQRILLE